MFHHFPGSMDDEEEVLSALATQMGQFSDYVGGKQYAHTLLEPLKILCGVEDPPVREKV